MNDTRSLQRGTSLRRLGRATVSGANRLLAPLDRLVPGDGTESRPLLVVTGLPRSGTTLVYQLILQAFDAGYLTRLFQYTWGLPKLTLACTRPFTDRPKPLYRSNYGRIPGLLAPAENHVVWSRWFPERRGYGHYVPALPGGGEARQALRATLHSLAAIARRPLVFKDVYLALSPRCLLESLPGARVLMVEREPEAVMASIYRKRALHPDAEGWWSLRPPFSEDVAAADRAEQVAFQCTRSRQVIASQAPVHERLMTVDYRDVCASPQAFLDRLDAWLPGDFAPRDRSGIPSEFTASGAAGIDGQAERALHEHAERLERDREDYLRRVADLAGDAADAGAGRRA